MGVRIYILCLLLGLSNLSNSQNLVYKFLTIKEGLPTNNIFKIKFDPKGFLWIAHDNGISRYDGYTFKHYISPEQKSNVYTDLCIAPDGKVWMTNLGLQIFYIENDEMKLFKSFNLNYPPSTIRVNFLSNGNLVVNAEGGIIEFDLKNGKEYKYSMNLSIQNFAVNKDIVYFNNPNTGHLYTLKNGKIDTFDIHSPYYIIYADDSCIISCYNVSTELYINSGKHYQKRSRIPLGFNYNHSEVIGKYLYIFSTGNIITVNLFEHKYQSKEIMNGRNYTHCTVDNLGNEWYSTLNEGIIIKPYSNVQLVEVGEKSPFLRLIQFRNQALGITVDNQLYSLLDKQIVKKLDLNEKLGFKPVIVAKNLNNRFLLLGNSQFVLVDTQFKVHDYIQQLAMKDASLVDNGNIYLATTGNILYHKFNDRFVKKLSGYKYLNDADSIFRVGIIGRFNCTKFDSINKVLYFGGIPGFFSYKQGERAIEIKNGKDQIYTSFIDFKPPYIIVGTIQSGIFILKNGTIFRHFDNLNSTLGNTIIKIKLYENYIWALSNKGIHTIDLRDFNIQSFFYIGAVDLNRNSDFTLSNDILYLISGQKTYKVNLKELRKSPPVIPMYFNYIETGGKKLFNLDHLKLRYDANSFAIGIENPAAPVLGNIEYEYRINKNSWFPLSKGQDKIYLSQLSPGDYTLYIRQIGILKTYTLRFSIDYPFWERWWFYVIIAFILVILIAIIYINRVNRIRQKTHSEIEKFKLEKALQLNVLSSIRSQMNPHFLFNALNTIQSYIYLNDKKQAINYLGKFSVLTRKILEESNRETISLGEEIETLELYLQLEKMRFENTLDYSVEMNGIKFPEQIKIPPMIIQPYVENAVKHGLMHKPNNRNLKIQFVFDDDQKLLQVIIDDNGIGRRRSEEINSKKNAAHRSFSTKANKTRLDILNSDRSNPISVLIIDKTDYYNNPIGTTVQINIPVL